MSVNEDGLKGIHVSLKFFKYFIWLNFKGSYLYVYGVIYLLFHSIITSMWERFFCFNQVDVEEQN